MGESTSREALKELAGAVLCAVAAMHLQPQKARIGAMGPRAERPGYYGSLMHTLRRDGRVAAPAQLLLADGDIAAFATLYLQMRARRSGATAGTCCSLCEIYRLFCALAPVHSGPTPQNGPRVN